MHSLCLDCRRLRARRIDIVTTRAPGKREGSRACSPGQHKRAPIQELLQRLALGISAIGASPGERQWWDRPSRTFDC